ncbi:sensor domain-containing diguanylate cyclase [bacterium]|nr:MAG: sensor domain-containing diguanylate cyclase [bacterium]
MSNLRHDLGVPTASSPRNARFLAPGEQAEGLPIILAPGAVVDLPDPMVALGLDPEVAGIVTVRPEGIVRGCWGMVCHTPELQPGVDLKGGPFSPILTDEPASVRHGTVRVISTPDPKGGWRLLAVDARHEQAAQDGSEVRGRLAQGLKRLGKALSMNQNLGPLCLAAVHEIASATELAAVLLWRHIPESESMELAASVGVNKQGSTSLGRLAVDGAPGCAAELVAMTQRPFYAPNVAGHVLTQEIEGRFCYLRPGGLRVLPLEISGRLLGVLELVGREGDEHFETDVELHHTVSEHLALALNGATLYENLERLASHDPLTGLANHRALQDFLHWRIAECDRTAQTLGCIMIDVDHFRDFNEQEGHDAGDEVLRQVAEALRSSVRPYDLAARYGGEEFTVLVPGASSAGVRGLAERLRDRIAARPFVTSGGREVPLTVSVGCAVYPAQGSDAPSLLKAADVALYEAKRTGRNRVEGPEPMEGMNRLVAGLRVPLGEEAWCRGTGRLSAHASDIDGISMTLRLTAEQRTLLEALIVASDAWLAESDRLRHEPAFSPLVPLLEAMRRPHDSDSPAPLLARVLQALLSAEPQAVHALPRMDPEIVDLVARIRGGN